MRFEHYHTGFCRIWAALKTLSARIVGALLLTATAFGGTWTPLTTTAPGEVELMLLLPDGTVMAANQPAFGSDVGQAWFRLTPDAHGSYVNGTWTTLASMHSTRLYCSTTVLRDGRVFIAGGEYGTGPATAEVYDPLSNTWTLLPPSGQTFSDSISKILPNGNVLIAPVNPSTAGGTVIFNPVANTWLAGPTLFSASSQDEASWVKLPDDSIVTIDPFSTTSERYIPSLNRWIGDATVPVSLYTESLGELGAAFLLPDGRAFFLGGTGQTAFYTPTGTTNAGAWSVGPVIPGGFGINDAAAAMMVNGKILCAVGSATTYDAPTFFYEFDYLANSFTSVNGPTGTIDNVAPFQTMMLDLPDGTVLYSDFGSSLYVYQPTGAPLASGKPVINNISQNADGSYHLVGTLLNGISEGAAYGDDAQMNSNYPLIRLTDSAGHVHYARTYNWSSAGVMTGGTLESTDFVLPAGLAPGTNSLVVSANGIISDPVSFTPHALQITPLTGFASSGLAGGPFTIAAQNFTLTNVGTASLNWTLANPAAWLSVSPGSGTLAPGGPAAIVTASLNSNASNSPAGTYTTAVSFNNLTDGSSQTRQFSLQITPTNGFQPYSNMVMSFNPAAYWRLNETNQPPSAGTAANLGFLGTDGDGSYTGSPAWVAGALVGSPDTAAGFNGASSVNVPFTPSLSLSPPFTIEAWVKATVSQTPGNFACALACGEFASPRSGWLIYQSATGWNFRMYDQNDLNTSLNIETGGAPVPGVWYHVAAVYDGTTGFIYVNGVGISANPPDFVPNVDGPLTIGIRSDNAFAFNGDVDEVAVYTAALSPADILAHYQNGTNSSPATPYDQLILADNPMIYSRLDAPGPLPAAVNSGSLGAGANGVYEPGVVPGVPGVPLAAFGSSNQACQFNGLVGNIYVPGTSLNFTGTVTLLAWVNVNPANGIIQTIIGKGDTSYRLYLDQNGHPVFADGQQPVGDLVAATRVDDGLWHQLAGVYDGLHSEYLYLDGALVASTTGATTPVAGNALDLWLGGALDYGPARLYSGTVDEAAIFNAALSAAQIQQIYNDTLTTAPVFQAITQNHGTLSLSWSALSGRNYQLQSRTALNQGGWTNLGTLVNATNSTATTSEAVGPDPQRFYRVLLLP